MPEEYKVIVVPEAQRDITEVLLYVAKEISATQVAIKLQIELRRGIDSLRFMPKRAKPIEEKPWGEMGVRRIRVQNYYVYYWLNDIEKVAYVIAVIYARMKQENQLYKRQGNCRL